MLNNSSIEDLISYKLILLGLSASGKTKLLTRYKYNVYLPQGTTTLAIDNHTKTKTPYKFVYYDTAGQDKYRCLMKQYYFNSDACLIIYDTTDYHSFEEISYYYNCIKELTPNSMIFLIGTKSDLDNNITKDLITKNYKGIPNYITSAKNDINVSETFCRIEQQLIKNIKKNNKSTVIRPFDFVRESRIKKPCCSSF